MVWRILSISNWKQFNLNAFINDFFRCLLILMFLCVWKSTKWDNPLKTFIKFHQTVSSHACKNICTNMFVLYRWYVVITIKINRFFNRNKMTNFPANLFPRMPGMVFWVLGHVSYLLRVWIPPFVQAIELKFCHGYRWKAKLL